jgi:ribosomal protein L33
MAKKSSRVRVGLVCTETNIQNYVVQLNLQKDKDLELMKFCPHENKKTKHKVRKKLK